MQEDRVGRSSRTSSQADGLRGTQTPCWSRRKASWKVNLITYKKKSNKENTKKTERFFFFTLCSLMADVKHVLRNGSGLHSNIREHPRRKVNMQ